MINIKNISKYIMQSLAVNFLVLSIIPMISTAIFQPLTDNSINGLPTGIGSNFQSGSKPPNFSAMSEYFRI